MAVITCRDCGSKLDTTSRGCQTCALNLEAENMIDRFVRRAFVGLVIVLLLTVGAVVYLVR